MGCPDLRPIADEIIAIFDGCHLQACEIRARAWFGVSLTPPIITRQDAGQEIVFLLLIAVTDEHGSAHADTHGRQAWGLCCGAFTLPDVALNNVPSGSPMFDRPTGGHPALGEEFFMPFQGAVMV